MADPRAILSVSGPDLPTDQIQVGKGKFTIGRVPENNLPLNNQKVSRRHADIYWENGTFVIEDLDSSNGTLFNGDRLEGRKPTPINVKDVITIGPFTLTVVSIDGGADAPPPKPVEVLTPEPAAPIPQAAPPVGAPAAEEAPAPAVYTSEPPVPSHEAPTIEPQRTTPAAPAEPAAAAPVDGKAGRDGKAGKQPAAAEKADPVAARQDGQDGKDGHAGAPAAPAAAPVADAIKPRPIDAAMMVPPPPRPPSANGRRPHITAKGPIEGVPTDESRYMQYLPGVYHDSDFLKRYLLIMESMLAPLEWGIDSFEQFYNPNVTTPDWLQWIGFWFDVFIHPTVPIERQRAVVRELAALYRARGTRRALSRLLELYFGVKPEIIEQDDPPSSFKVRLKLAAEDNTLLNKALAEQLITVCKPAYTSFTLEISQA